MAVAANELRAARQMLRLERVRRTEPPFQLIFHYVTDDGCYAETERVIMIGGRRKAPSGMGHPIGEERPCPLAGQRVPGTRDAQGNWPPEDE